MGSEDWLGYCRLRNEWRAGLSSVTPRDILRHLLGSDLRHACLPTLPSDVEAWHGKALAGRFFLQLDEAVDIGQPARSRFKPTNKPSTRKLLLTDGTKQVVALEQRPLVDLPALAPAGTKLLVEGPMVRGGMLLVHPNNTAVLGGRVPLLERAQRAAEAAWNEPVVGRPKELPSLQSLALKAAQAAKAVLEEGTVQGNGAPLASCLEGSMTGNSNQRLDAGRSQHGTTAILQRVDLNANDQHRPLHSIERKTQSVGRQNGESFATPETGRGMERNSCPTGASSSVRTQGQGTVDDPILLDDQDDGIKDTCLDTLGASGSIQQTERSSNDDQQVAVQGSGPSSGGGAASRTEELPQATLEHERASSTIKHHNTKQQSCWSPPTLASLEDGLLDAETPTLSQVLKKSRRESSEEEVRAFPVSIGDDWQWTEAQEEDGRLPAPGFDILGMDDDEEMDSVRGQAPFEYLADLLAIASHQEINAERLFPIKSRIWGVVQRTVGRLQFQLPPTGEEQYHMELIVEDGTAAVTATLGHQFLLDFFDMPPLQFKRQLSSPNSRATATALAQGLTTLIAQYCGLMQVSIAGPNGPLIVEDLPGPLSEMDVKSLAARNGG